MCEFVGEYVWTDELQSISALFPLITVLFVIVFFSGLPFFQFV